jgi:mannose-6-phosphate isomerase-like protein (cupin superfamily)
MAIKLEGGCRVSNSREGEPDEHGTLRLWKQIGRPTGAVAISLRTLEFRPGLSPGIRNPDCDEILYTLEGSGTVFVNGRRYGLECEAGIYLRPWDILTVENQGPGPFVLISSQCPEPQSEIQLLDPLTVPPPDSDPREQEPIVRLSDRKAIPTSDRWYRVLVNDEVGSTHVTQFVGSIPPGRAPDHYHNYEEALVILLGTGRVWSGESSTPIAPGSCVYLPRGQVHCVENTGASELRLLGVFYPAGSPGARYDADT